MEQLDEEESRQQAMLIEQLDEDEADSRLC